MSMKMNMDTAEDFAGKNFQVISSVANEEYILSELTPEASSSPQPNTAEQLKSVEEKLIVDHLSDDKTSLKKSVALTKNIIIEVDSDEECFIEKDPSSDEKTSLKKSLALVKNDVVELDSDEERLIDKEESKWEDIGIEEELTRFINTEENAEKEDKQTITSNTAQFLKNGEMSQEVLQLQPEYEKDCNKTPKISLHPQPKRKEELNPANAVTAAKQTWLDLSINSKLLRGHNQGETEDLNDSNTSLEISSNTHLLRNLLISATSSSQYEQEKARKTNLVELKLTHTTQRSEDDHSDENNRNTVSSHNSVFITKQNAVSSCAAKRISTKTKRKEPSGRLHVYQSSKRSKHVTRSLLKCAVNNRRTEKIPPTSGFQTDTEATQSLVQDTTLDSSSISKELSETNKICPEITDSFTSSAASNLIYSQSLHTSSCECLNCQRKRASSETVAIISKKPFLCQICNKSFKRESYLKEHISGVHVEEKKFVCHHCCKAYNRKTSLEYHMSLYHDPSSYKLRCKKCRKQFANDDRLKRHWQRAHLKDQITLPETCDICLQVFTCRQVMLGHKRRKHATSNRQFICDDCAAVYPSKGTLINHIKTCHMPPEISCSQCIDLFPTKAKLEAHLLKEHGKYKKNFICETCGKTFNSKLGLKTHLEIHKSTKDYVCEECGKSFRTNMNLYQHSRVHSDRRFSCDLCSNSFRIRHHLQQHMAVHGMASTPNYNKRSRAKRKKTPVVTTSSDSVHENSSDESSE